MKGGIYRIIINEKIYIGSAVDLNRRKMAHLYSLRRGTHKNIKLQRSYNKHLEFVFEVIEYCLPENLLQREQLHIDSINPYFNICRIAGRTFGVKHSESTKRHLSSIRKGNQTSLGRVLSKETKAKISKKAIDRGLHPSFIKASIQANTGRKHTADHRNKIAKIQSKVSPETAQKIMELRIDGVFQKNIAKSLGISQTLVARVEHGIGVYKDYFDAGNKRFEQHKSQLKLFV